MAVVVHILNQIVSFLAEEMAVFCARISNLGTKTAILAEKPNVFSARIAAAVYLLSSTHPARHQRNVNKIPAVCQPDTIVISARH